MGPHSGYGALLEDLLFMADNIKPQYRQPIAKQKSKTR
jgi:hypothetical protein